MIGLDPQATWEVGFEYETHLPREQRTMLRVRFLTAGQYNRMVELQAEANNPEIPNTQRVTLLGQALAVAGQQWAGPRGIEPFEAAKLPDLMTIDEHWELTESIRSGSRLQEIERKKSLSRSASAAASTVAGAGPAA